MYVDVDACMTFFAYCGEQKKHIHTRGKNFGNEVGWLFTENQHRGLRTINFLVFTDFFTFHHILFFFLFRTHRSRVVNWSRTTTKSVVVATTRGSIWLTFPSFCSRRSIFLQENGPPYFFTHSSLFPEFFCRCCTSLLPLLPQQAEQSSIPWTSSSCASWVLPHTLCRCLLWRRHLSFLPSRDDYLDSSSSSRKKKKRTHPSHQVLHFFSTLSSNTSSSCRRNLDQQKKNRPPSDQDIVVGFPPLGKIDTWTFYLTCRKSLLLLLLLPPHHCNKALRCCCQISGMLGALPCARTVSTPHPACPVMIQHTQTAKGACHAMLLVVLCVG